MRDLDGHESINEGFSPSITVGNQCILHAVKDRAASNGPVDHRWT